MRTGTDYISAAPLIVLRAGFGLLMAISMLRFWANGWIEKLYLQPTFFFSYRYLEWIEPPGQWTYPLFAVVALAAVGVMLGYRYRLSLGVFFLGFTYIEAMDKTTYLNHYYFISLLALVLLFLPVPSGFPRGRRVHRYYLYALRVFVGIVYVYAGLAKLNSDWLLHAQPLAIWLPAKYDLPLLGDLLQQRWVHFTFAWAGALFDLTIPFLLLWRPTRWWAFAAVVVFHVLTRLLFPIGMFPFIMMLAATVFLPVSVHRHLLELFGRGRRCRVDRRVQGGSPFGAVAIGLLLLFHLIFPWRYLARPGELFWTEDGYRFSWRVMLMEKAGLANFRIEDAAGRKRATVDNREFLTPFQEKQMATQPDFIVEYAHFLAETYRERGFEEPRVFVDSYVALNGRLSQRYVDPKVDLTTLSRDTPPRKFLLPFNDTIRGL
jgi:hypothetical protein